MCVDRNPCASFKYDLSHSWVHPDEAAEKSKAEARYDYHQTPDKITINVYCKGIIPNKSKVAISCKRADINVSIFNAYIKLLRHCL